VGGNLEVEVAVNNSGTGHHVPTGVTVRNMILLVEAWRESDGQALASTGAQVVHDLGGVGDPAQGYYAGLPGKYFAKLNHDQAGAGPTFFTDAVGIIFDNRIPALGVDVTNYSFTAPAADDTLQVRARLIYRRAFRALVDAKGWTEDGHGEPLEDVLPPYYGHLMEETEREVEVVSCLAEPFGEPCSDGNPCNGEESCDGAGACLPGLALVCDDGEACTTETCEPNSGCVFEPRLGSCEDGDACTVDDLCSLGLCVSGLAADCDDGDVCSDDTCNPASGCEYADNTAVCDDGDACTTVDQCSTGACVGSIAPDCNDGNACTQDSCETASGCVNAAEPALTCQVPATSLLAIRDKSDDNRDSLRWKWKSEVVTDLADLGTPDAATTYSLCVYDAGEGQRIGATSLAVPPSSNWRNQGTKGWSYKDTSGSNNGVTKLRLKVSPIAKTIVDVRAKGSNFPIPAAASTFGMFDADPEVLVQLVNDSSSACWESTFDGAVISRNRRDDFRANLP
jgi:hypothetical protein